MDWTTMVLMITLGVSVALIPAFRMLSNTVEAAGNTVRAQNYYNMSWFMAAWSVLVLALLFV